MSSTVSQLSSQWANPSDVTTVLMVIGGDVVQKALAQTTGCWYTPVCFSFGWVAYMFMALVGIIGDGRLLPIPDYPAKVFNLKTGYVRDNKNWVIGRLLRDHEAYMSRKEPAPTSGVRIAVWEAKENKNCHKQISFSHSRIHIWGGITMAAQLIIAAIPVIKNHRWGILLITASGTVLALMVGGLPQWRAEKLPNRQQSKKVFALTTGNGSRDIMVIIGAGKILDLEDLSAQETPRSEKPWEKFKLEASRRPQRHGWAQSGRIEKFMLDHTGSFHFSRMKVHGILTRPVRGLPAGFLLTMVVCVVQSILWLLLLITVAALSTDTWYLILVGGIGMFQNGYLAAMERTPEHRNCPLELKEVITTAKVMDGLMDLEVAYGRDFMPNDDSIEPIMTPLVKEFFPGRLRLDEEDWWKGKCLDYDQIRSKEKEWRGVPRRAMHPDAAPKEYWNAPEKAPLYYYGGNQIPFEKFQPVVSSTARYDWGINSDRQWKVEHEPISRPKSPQQAYHASSSRLPGLPEGEAFADLAHVTGDTRIVQARRSNSMTSEPQRNSMLQFERTFKRDDPGYTFKSPPWS
ncbi:hypothetical protein PFICI_03988 [Pestalotiopsis fici W106-1]|uniref:Uncharacterized protein n=1 Tax=Pestalotiopsis fici (strain W106-1 / CGMCC3.15140) TaxID=1229662 RepID=W3XIR5_PESFW|nr:uncharacterized protein PFICI_03988 [Pestalotiopsis fici W106-1]ETS85963.1 hypothetical protein PFICI_03988 [Pestalotiopsis fici W106-1]